MKSETLKKETSDTSVSGLRKLILFNSGHLWDEVITQLRLATGFDIIQCEQIAIFAHTKVKALVKSGTTEELESINRVLKEIRLITEIE